MKRQKPVVVALVAGSFCGQEVAQGAVEYFSLHGQWEIRYEGGVTESNALQAIRDWHAEGIILQVNSGKWIPGIKRFCPAVVNVCGQLETGLPTVIANNLAIGEMAARHFLDRHFRHFAAYGPGNKWFSRNRVEGFSQTLARAGFEAHAHWAPASYRANRSAILRWLQGLPKPLAVFGCSDYWAREVLGACAMGGLAVPTEVACIGVDNDPVLCELNAPPLSSVILPVRRIGYEAARLLHGLLRHRHGVSDAVAAKPPGGELAVEPLLLPPLGIATRQSSDVLAIEDKLLAQAVQFMQANADKSIDVSAVLAHVHLSRRALEMRFRNILGLTLQKEIRRLHIERAKMLLVAERMKISQVAMKSGFSGYEVFSRIFKMETGFSPGQYRRKFGST